MQIILCLIKYVPWKELKIEVQHKLKINYQIDFGLKEGAFLLKPLILHLFIQLQAMVKLICKQES